MTRKEKASSTPHVFLLLMKELLDALNAVDYKGKENTVYQQLMNLAADG